MKGTLKLSFVFLALVLFFGAPPFAHTEEIEMTTQVPAPPAEALAYATGASKSHAPVIRVYKDTNAWFGENRDTATLLAMGKILGDDWFVHPVADCQKGIPQKTAVVFFSSNGYGLTSSTAAQNHPDCQAALETFVKAGGALIVDMGDNDWAGGYRAPGATGTPAYLFPFPCADATLAPQASGHLMVKGPDGVAGSADDLTNANIDMSGACWVSHGHLGSGGGMAPPSGTTPLMTAVFSGAPQPILAEYRYGNGLVILDTITKEYGRHQPTGTGQTFFLKNLLHYAMSSVPWPFDHTLTHAPTLSFSAESGFVSDGINPNKGTASSTVFTLKTVYADADNNPPDYVRAIVDGAQYAMHRDEATTTPEALRDGNYANGEQYAVVIGPFPKGTYAYLFDASDGSEAARLPAIGTLSFETGYSNVAFLPGFEGSRLYRQGVLGEDQLWEPTWNQDVEQLYLDPVTGESLDRGIYTKDIIDESPQIINGYNIYKTFAEFMNSEVQGQLVNEWKSLPYDWRLDYDDILASGKIIGGNQETPNISYLEATSSPYILQELRRLAETSITGKVTIIGHSNGGLLAKYILKTVESPVHPYHDILEKIDKLILVAAPQVGTPAAVEGLLHGDEQQLGVTAVDFGFLIDEERVRELGENMISAFNLLPSREYFGVVSSPVLEFDQSVSRLPELSSRANTAVASFNDLNAFLGGDGMRIEPAPNDDESPNVLKARLLIEATKNHDEVLDVWTPSANIQVIQIAG